MAIPQKSIDMGDAAVAAAPQRETAVAAAKLPFSRVKRIIKSDPDVHGLGADAVVAVARATVRFPVLSARTLCMSKLRKTRKSLSSC